MTLEDKIEKKANRFAENLVDKPMGTMIRLFFRVFVLLFLFIGLPLGILGYACGWFSEAAVVAQEEFGPRAMLKKYEWFKDAAAALDKKQADIKVYEARMQAMNKDYEGERRKDWPRSDREQYNVWTSELAGVKASYNGLAAEYNAAMAKFNWRFANAGDLPEGATVPLPREYKPYESQ